MVSVYADTSFLASVYLADANTPAALAKAKKLSRPLILTSWQIFELENAFQLRIFRGESDPAEIALARRIMTADIATGAMQQISVSLASALERSRQLSAQFSSTLGTRAVDIFHVACAVELGTSHFLSFAHRQLRLANAAGLRSA